MLDDFVCEIQSDELIPEGWDEDLDDFGYEISASTEEERSHRPDDDWRII